MSVQLVSMLNLICANWPMNVKLLHHGRQRSRVVRASDLKSAGRGFKPCSDC